MSNALIMRPLPISGVTIDTLTAAGVIAHVGQEPGADYMGLFWRGQGTAVRFFVDLGSDQIIDTIAMLCVAGADSATWSMQYNTNANGTNWTTPSGTASFGAVNAGANALANGRQAALWCGDAAAPITARYLRIIISGATTDSFQLSRIVIGRRWVPARNFSFGAAFGVRSFGSVSYSDRANLLRRRGPHLRVVGLTYPNLYRDEVEATVQPLLELAADDVPLLLVTDPDAHAMRTRRIYFGHLEGDLGTVWRNARAWEFRANLVSLF